VILEVQISQVKHQLIIKAVGQYSLTGLRALIDRVKEEGDKRGEGRVILDVTEVAGTVPVVELHLLGEHVSRFWKEPFRAAIISPKGGLNQFFEYVARKRGARIAVVPDQDAAIEWVG
jgi:hypothetical protein